MKKIEKTKKTYAIYHLTEKHTFFMLGKMKVHVSFTGGEINKKGVTPATFITSDPIVQLAIERSSDFKNGAIKIISHYPIGGEVLIGHNDPKIVESDPESKVNTSETDDISETIQKEKELNCSTENPESVGTYPHIVSTAEETEPKSETDAACENKLEIVDASCKDVAKQYLQEHYGENPAPLRTREDVQNCAAKHGIKFNFV